MIPELNEKVEKLINKQISDGRQIGVQVCAYHYGEKIVDTWAGSMGPDSDRPVQADSLFNCFSAGKGVAATALHILADKGIIEYDAPVADYWPKFGKHGKDKVTVAEALSHRTGVYTSPTEHDFDLHDWEAGIKYVEDAIPSFTPGTKRGYQNLTFSWIVGGIIEKASGSHISDVIRDWIAKPLGVEHEMYAGIPDGVENRLTTIKVWNPEKLGYPPDSEFFKALPRTREEWEKCNDIEMRKACLISFNGHFTARALARMYGTLANGGEIDGVRIVSSSRIKEMQRFVTEDFDVVTLSSGRGGIGFDLGGEKGHKFGPRSTAFGHSGAGGSQGYADPDIGLSIGVTLNMMEMLRDRTIEICELIRNELGYE